MSKYQKLKKQKKALLKQKAPPARNESEPLPTNTGSSGMGGGGISGGRPRSPKIGARDAKEIAKKLVKSGTVIIKRAPSPTNEGFKRPLGLERKLISTEKSVGYQPFSATVMEGYGDSAGKVFRKNRYGSPIDREVGAHMKTKWKLFEVVEYFQCLGSKNRIVQEILNQKIGYEFPRLGLVMLRATIHLSNM